MLINDQLSLLDLQDLFCIHERFDGRQIGVDYRLKMAVVLLRTIGRIENCSFVVCESEINDWNSWRNRKRGKKIPSFALFDTDYYFLHTENRFWTSWLVESVLFAPNRIFGRLNNNLNG